MTAAERQNPLDLHHFANALMTVRAADRAALARALIKRAGDVAEKRRQHNLRFAAVLPSHWSQDFQSVCLAQKLDAEAANPGSFYIAGIADRDGLQAYEVALYALLDVVRDAEKGAAA